MGAAETPFNSAIELLPYKGILPKACKYINGSIFIYMVEWVTDEFDITKVRERHVFTHALSDKMVCEAWNEFAGGVQRLL